MTEKDTRLLHTMMPEELITRINNFRFDYHYDSRAEAIRFLVSWALGNYKGPGSAEGKKGYKLINKVLQKIAKKHGREFGKEVALATVEEYDKAPDKSDFDYGVFTGAHDYLMDLLERAEEDI